MAMKNVKKYYVQDSVMRFEEDDRNEFKGHQNLAVEELPLFARASPSARASRKPVSYAINGFLNTGKGGTVYLGVSDDGKILGLPLTIFQKDHIIFNMLNLMKRYQPPVRPDRYSIEFVPVVSKESTEEERKSICLSKADEKECPLERKKRHLFQTFLPCWCKNDAIARFNNGTFNQAYIVEIKIKPWDPMSDKGNDDDDESAENLGGLNLHPLYRNEEGKVLVRSQASVVMYDVNDVVNLTRQEVKQHFEEKIRKLKEQIQQLKK